MGATGPNTFAIHFPNNRVVSNDRVKLPDIADGPESAARHFVKKESNQHRSGTVIVELHILGPLRRRDGGPLEGLHSHKHRGLLGILLVHANVHVHRDKIARWLWDGENSPSGGKKQVQKLVSDVRKALQTISPEPELLLVNEDYVLKIDEKIVDYYCFQGLVKRGCNACLNGDDEVGVDLLGQALALWQDRSVLSNVDLPWARRNNEEMVAESLIPACRSYFEARLRRKEHELVLTELRPFIRRYDTNETLAILNMRALAEVEGARGVVEYYRGLLRRKRDEDEEEPGAELVEEYERLSGVTPTVVSRGATVPNMAPRLPTDFSGRGDVLATLDQWLLEPGPALVVDLHGVGGVGKTTIARFWANTRSRYFPDGTLYFDLDEYLLDGSGGVTAAVVAFLTELGITELPGDEAVRFGMLRHRLKGRRVLVILDNVRSLAEVRPLLDATASCQLLITTRVAVSATDCRPLAVSPLSRDESVKMLREQIFDRPEDNPAALEAIAEVCGDLPLGLRIAVGFVSQRSEVPIGELAAQLQADRGRRLLYEGEGQRLRAVFASSCEALPPAEQRFVLLLGLHPEPVFSLPVAVALSGEGVAAVERMVATLVRANLVEQKTAGSWRLHGIVHAYLRDASEDLEADVRAAAVRRMADFYQATVSTAMRLVAPYLTEVPALPSPRTAEPLEFATAEEALAWCDEQRPQVTAVSRFAADNGLHGHVWRIIGPFGEFLRKRRGVRDGAVDVHMLALRSARFSGERIGEAMSLANLALLLVHLGRYREAEQNYEEALAICREFDDVMGQAACLHGLGGQWLGRDRPELAIKSFEQGLELFEQARNLPAQSNVHLYLGDAHAQLRDIETAETHYEIALDIRERLGAEAERAEALVRFAELHLDRDGDPRVAVERCVSALDLYRRERNDQKSIGVLRVLARARAMLGEHEEAVEAARESATLAESCGEPKAQATALDLAARSLAVLGEPVEAEAAWAEALAFFEEIGDVRAAELREQLRGAAAVQVLPGQRADDGPVSPSTQRFPSRRGQ